MNTTSAIRILLADDHVVVRMGLRSMIESEPGMQVVAEAGNGEEALKQYGRVRPDLVLMDLRMPRVGGVEATSSIRAFDAKAHILILTTYDGDESIYQALKAGAQGYLLKDVTKDEFILALRKVAAGEYYLPQNVAARLAQRVPAGDLSQREMDVLKLIVEGQSNKEIAETLALSESTVKNHVNSILTKLHVKDRTQAATMALKRGMVNLD